MRDEIETECCNQNSILSVSDLLTKFHHRIDRHRSCSCFGANIGAKRGAAYSGRALSHDLLAQPPSTWRPVYVLVHVAGLIVAHKGQHLKGSYF